MTTSELVKKNLEKTNNLFRACSLTKEQLVKKTGQEVHIYDILKKFLEDYGQGVIIIGRTTNIGL